MPDRDTAPDPADVLDALLPGWIESGTRHRFLHGVTGAAELTDRVRAAWRTGDLHHEDGLWWTPPPTPPTEAEPVGPDAAGTSLANTVTLQMRDLCLQGRPDEALRHGTLVIQEVLATHGPGPTLDAHLSGLAVGSVLALCQAGRVLAADTLARTGHAESITRAVPLAQGWFAAMLGLTELSGGRILDSRRHLAEALVLARLCDDARLTDVALTTRTMAYSMVGEQIPPRLGPTFPADGVDGHDDDPADGPRTDDDLDPLGQQRALDEVRNQAWTRGAPTDLDHLAAAADAAKARGHFGHAATLLGEMALLGAPAEAAKGFADFGPLDGDLLPRWPEVARALADDDTEVLVDVAAAFEALGIRGLAAALTLRGAAIELERRPERARELLAEANRRAEGLQLGDQYLAHFRRLLPLREREREIAELAARGLTNKAIAEQLVLSIRTVENHLYRVYEKLGIEGREALVGLFSSTLGPDGHDR